MVRQGERIARVRGWLRVDPVRARAMAESALAELDRLAARDVSDAEWRSYDTQGTDRGAESILRRRDSAAAEAAEIRRLL